ncbi:unnamed protein product [Symbiodinium sp. CCMP2592]|nr:unnamed protein product [Symbiodinium sp. CCMP2592]
MSWEAQLAGAISSLIFVVLNCAMNIYTKWLFSPGGGNFALPWTMLTVQQLEAFLVLQPLLAWKDPSGNCGWPGARTRRSTSSSSSAPLTTGEGRDEVSETLGANVDFVSECQSLFWLGYVASTMMLLPAFDTYGRKKPFFLAGWIGLFAAGVSFLTTEAWVYALCQFMIGFSLMPVGNMSYVWASELVPASSHNNVCSIFNICYSAVCVGMAAASYGMKDTGISWQVQQALWYLPVALGLLAGPFLVPESLEPTVASQKLARSGEGLESVFRQPVLSQTLATMVCWFAVATGYYGLSYASGNLAPDLYLQMGLLSLVDICCYGDVLWFALI